MAQSFCKAESVSAAEAVKEATWTGRLLGELLNGYNAFPVPVFYDNQGAIALAKNPELYSRIKHIDIRYHFLRESVSEAVITLSYVPTNDMVADGLTKPLAKPKFEKWVDQMGLRDC